MNYWKVQLVKNRETSKNEAVESVKWEKLKRYECFGWNIGGLVNNSQKKDDLVGIFIVFNNMSNK